MQTEILDQNPDEDIHVLAVWFNVLSPDDRSQWPDDLLTDPRVTHLWDEEVAVGTWFADNQGRFETAGYVGPLAWDIYYLFGPDSTWDEVPTLELGSGTPVVGRGENLRSALDAIWAD